MMKLFLSQVLCTWLAVAQRKPNFAPPAARSWNTPTAHDGFWGDDEAMGFRGCHWESWRCSLSVQSFARRIAGNQSFPLDAILSGVEFLPSKLLIQSCFFFFLRKFDFRGFWNLEPRPKSIRHAGCPSLSYIIGYYWILWVFMSIGQRKHIMISNPIPCSY